MTTTDFTAKVCKPCESGVPALTADEIGSMLPQVQGWARALGRDALREAG